MYTIGERNLHVVRGVIYNGSGELLVAQRASGCKRGAGLWEFVGGKADLTDTNPSAALIREVREEVGVAIQIDPFSENGYTHSRSFWHEGTKKTVLTSFLTAIALTEALKPDPAEVGQAMWMAADEVRLLPLAEASRNALGAFGLAYGLEAA